jgi:thiosulfate reductase cytochrome b subunit
MDQRMHDPATAHAAAPPVDAPHADTPAIARARTESGVIHPRWVRVAHWLNALAMVLMILSGWRIYNASPLFAFEFPEALTIGAWLGGAIQWHFAAMWLLTINGLVYLALGFATGRFRRKLWPIHPRAVVADLRAAFKGQLAHDDLSVYNAVQRLLYAGIMIVGVVVALSGLAIWKPVQFQELTALFGGFDAARYVHFVCMAAIVGFLAVHIAMALGVPKSLRAMILGK